MTFVEINVFLISLHLATTNLDILHAKSDYCTCLRGKYNRSYNGKLEFTFSTGNCSSSADILHLNSVIFICMYGFDEEYFKLDFDSSKIILLKNDSVGQNGMFTLLYQVALDDCQPRILNISVIKPEEFPPKFNDSSPTPRKGQYLIITALLILVSSLLGLVILTLITYCRRRRRHRLGETDDETTVLYHHTPTDDHLTKKSVLVVTVDYNKNSILMELLQMLNNRRELDIVYPEKEIHCVSLNTNKWISESVKKCNSFIIVLSDTLMSSILQDSMNEFFYENPMDRINRQLFFELYEKLQSRQNIEGELCLINLNAEPTLMESFKNKYHKLFCHCFLYDFKNVDSPIKEENTRRDIDAFLGRFYHNINVTRNT